ncbi:MAG: YhfC family intramembrane metalloprotease [Lachnospiraceae bacterium]|nr:YhfC family intramembrane metalloprotease [Lachnospiraceae bacterium]
MISTFIVILLVAEIIIAATTPLLFFAIIRFRKLCNFAPFAAGIFVYLIIYPIELVSRGYILYDGDALRGIFAISAVSYVVVSGVITLIFNELLMYLIFRYIVKDSCRRHDGLAFGTGFVLVDVVVRTFYGAFYPVMAAGLINEAGPEAFIASQEDSIKAGELVKSMQELTSSGIILDTINLLLLIAIQIGLSMICFYAVRKKSYQFLWFAMLLDFLYILPNTLVTGGVIDTGAGVVLASALFALLILYVAARLFKDYDKTAAYPDIKTFFGIGGRRLGQ